MINNSKISPFRRPFVFISQWRSLPRYELISYFFMFTSVPMITYGFKPYNIDVLKIIIFSNVSLYSGFFASLIWNDITDADIDAIAHPDRPIPSGKINEKRFFKIAIFFSISTFFFAALISIWCLLLVGIAALFVFVHNKHLKKKVKLPAYSEIFGPFQWVVVAIFGFFAIWTNFPNSSEIYFYLPFLGKISASFSGIYQMIFLILFTYFADSSHDIAEGIIDAKADLRFNVKTYSTTFGIKKAAIISFFMFFASAIFGIIFFIKSILSPVFIVLFLILFIYTIIYELRFLKSNNQKNNQYSKIAGRKLYNYFLFFYDLIFFGIMIQTIANYLLIN